MKELLINGGILFVIYFWQASAQLFIIKSLFNIDNNKSPIKDLSFVISLDIICILLHLLLPLSLSSLKPIVMFLAYALAFWYFTGVELKQGFLFSLLIMFISIPVEVLSGTIAAKVFHLSTNNDNILLSIPIFININIWFTFIALIIKLFKNKFSSLIDFKVFKGKFIYLNILAIILFVMPNIMFYTSNKYDYPLYLLIYNIVTNLCLVLLSAYNTYKNMQLEIKKRDLINSELHNKSLKELLDSIRVFKHDYNNLIHAIGGYISCGDIKGLEKYYKGASKEAKRVNRLESISPIKINEPSVYGLIAGKFEFADSKGVDFNFESIFDYQKLDMPIYDFCKIFGILLDNAIEAAEEVDELKEVNVYVRENKLEGYQAFVIENTYANKDVDTEQIYEKDFSTKNRNSGIGLWEVRRIVNKFDNVTLTTSKSDDYFRQELYVEIISKEAEEESPKELSSTLDS